MFTLLYFTVCRFCSWINVPRLREFFVLLKSLLGDIIHCKLKCMKLSLCILIIYSQFHLVTLYICIGRFVFVILVYILGRLWGWERRMSEKEIHTTFPISFYHIISPKLSVRSINLILKFQWLYLIRSFVKIICFIENYVCQVIIIENALCMGRKLSTKTNCSILYKKLCLWNFNCRKWFVHGNIMKLDNQQLWYIKNEVIICGVSIF